MNYDIFMLGLSIAGIVLNIIGIILQIVNTKRK